MSRKYNSSAVAAHDGLQIEWMILVSGGIGLCCNTEEPIQSVNTSDVSWLIVISNNAGIDSIGLGVLEIGKKGNSQTSLVEVLSGVSEDCNKACTEVNFKIQPVTNYLEDCR